MAISSRINSSLKKRRRTSFLKKIFYVFIFIIFFISLFILFLTSDKVIINTLKVSGNHSVPEEDILSVVNSILEKKYFWIIRTDNLFLIRNSEIKKEILDRFKKINSVKIGFNSLTNIEIKVSERSPVGIWCNGYPLKSTQCFFIDKTGFVFSGAPKFSGSMFTEYFGLINSEKVIGSNYFDSNKFSQIENLLKKLEEMNFYPKLFFAKDDSEYEVWLKDGGIIRFNNSQSFEKSILNLQALIDSGYIKTEKKFLQRINYIDLRFGNKVPFVLN